MVALVTALATVVQAIAEYKKTRDQALAAGVVTNADESVKSNEELIGLFRQDAQKLVEDADALLAKYSKNPTG